MGAAGEAAGEGTGRGEEDADGEEGRTGIPRERTNKTIRKTGEEKQNGMDKQEKNRKPVNQGRPYRRLRPGADLYQPRTDPGMPVAACGPGSRAHCHGDSAALCPPQSHCPPSLRPAPQLHRLEFHPQGCMRLV